MSRDTKAQNRVSQFRALVAAAMLVSGPTCLVAPTPVLAASPAAAAATVKIDNFTFGPATLAVKTGTTVTWVNNDDIPHAVVTQDHVTFKSKVLDTDQRFSFTFTRAGEYPYFCSLHPHMVGKVVVQN